MGEESKGEERRREEGMAKGEERRRERRREEGMAKGEERRREGDTRVARRGDE